MLSLIEHSWSARDETSSAESTMQRGKGRRRKCIPGETSKLVLTRDDRSVDRDEGDVHTRV